jgi:hypothetical protein
MLGRLVLCSKLERGTALCFRVQPAAPTGLPAPGWPLVHSPRSMRPVAGQSGAWFVTIAITGSPGTTSPHLVQMSRLRSPQPISETAGAERWQHDAATSARSVLGLADAEVADDEIVAPAKDADQLSVLFDGARSRSHEAAVVDAFACGCGRGAPADGLGLRPGVTGEARSTWTARVGRVAWSIRRRAPSTAGGFAAASFLRALVIRSASS